MRRAHSPILLVILLLTAGVPALLPDADAASTSQVGQLSISDARGNFGIVGHSAAHVNGATYIFGGRHADNSYSDKVYKFDHATGATTQVATLPAVLPSNSGGRYSASAMVLGGKIYYMGGAVLVMIDINGDGQADPVPQSSPDVFEFDPATNRVRQYSESLPRAAWGMSAVAVSPTKGYLFGGFTFSMDPGQGVDIKRRDSIIEFDLGRTGPAERKFRELPAILPYPVQDAGAAHVNGMVYLVGGLANNDNVTNPCPPYYDQGEERRPTVCQTRNILPFDVSRGAPRADLMREMPYRAQFLGAAAVNNRIYVPGGLLPDGTAANSIVEIVPGTNGAVRAITPILPVGVFGAGVVTDGTSVYVLGGRTGNERELTPNVVRIDVAPTVPWAPRGATATPIQGGLRISWEPPAYDGDSPVSLYRVYRSSLDEEESLLKETSTLAVDDLTIKPGAAYVYRISALNAVGESNSTARVSVNAGTTPPGPVRSFEAYPGDAQAVLRWQPPSETGGANLSGYRVVRDGRVVTTLTPDRLEYADTGLTNGVAYAYTIRAYNTRGDGEAAPVLRVSPAAVPPAPGALTAIVEEASVSISWEPPAAAWERFVIYRSDAPGQRGDAVATDVKDTRYVDTNVERGRTYYYHVASVNSAGESPPSAPATASLVRVPGAPANVQALGLEGEIRVAWQPPADTGDAPASALRYYVTRTGGGSPARIIATDLSVTSYTDRTIQMGVPYTYTVTTLNPLASGASAAVTATARQAENQPPVAVLSILPPVTTRGAPVDVDASQSSDPDGHLVSYVFDFGDGTDPIQTTTPFVSHSYDRNGTYDVRVIITDNRNTESSTSARLVVGDIEGDGSAGENPNVPTSGANRTNTRPGTATPGPGVLIVLAGLGVAAIMLDARRRHPPR